VVVVRPQSDWENPQQRISGPSPKGVPGTWVVHYPGSPSLYEPRTDEEMVRSLQASQRSYLNSRGYSYGYSVVASQSGSLWAVRGIEGFAGVRMYNPASNPGRKVGGGMNNVTRSIQIAVGGQNQASPEAVASVNALIATQPSWPVKWHGQIDYTSCAGDGIIEQIKSGVIGHQEYIPVGDDEMVALTKPLRWFDTREWAGPLVGGQQVEVELPSAMRGAKDVHLNVTITQPEQGGHLTVWPDGQRPTTSNLNFNGNQTLANGTLVRVGSDGKVRFWLHPNVGRGHLVVDIQGVRK
jgi:hypothetical protein